MTARLKSILVIVLVAAAIGVFFWVAKNLGGGESVESEKPAVICKPQNLPAGRQGAPPEEQECFWTAHIHATIKVFQGGDEIPIRFEQGELAGQHTHSEQNKIHWHGLIPVDPTTREVTDWSPLEVQQIVADFKISQEGTAKFIVNGREVVASHVWEDGDNIEIRYESR